MQEKARLLAEAKTAPKYFVEICSHKYEHVTSVYSGRYICNKCRVNKAASEGVHNCKICSNDVCPVCQKITGAPTLEESQELAKKKKERQAEIYAKQEQELQAR